MTDKAGMFRAKKFHTGILEEDETEYIEGYYVQIKHNGEIYDSMATGNLVRSEQGELHYEDCFIWPNTLEYLGGEHVNNQSTNQSTAGQQSGDGCEYCRDIKRGNYGLVKRGIDNEGEMKLFNSIHGWFIDVCVNDEWGYECNALFETDRCFNCGKLLKGD